MVRVFKTNVQSVFQANSLISEILWQIPKLVINFDLEDCDRILRVVGVSIPQEKIEIILRLEGFFCEELKD